MKWTLEKKLIYSFWVAFALLVSTRFISLLTTFRVINAGALVASTQEVRAKINEIESDVLIAETTRRGYVISSDLGFLEQYRQATNDFSVHLRELVKLTRNNPSEQEILVGLDTIVRKKTAQLTESIELKKSQPNNHPAQVAYTDEGKLLMEQIEEKLEQMRAMETSLVEYRITELDKRSRQKKTVSLVLISLDFILLWLAYRFLSRYVRERKRIEQFLYDESQLRAAIVNMQYEIAASELNLNKLLELIVRQAQELTRAEGAIIELLEGDELFCAAAMGSLSSRKGSRKKTSETFSGETVRKAQTLYCAETEKDFGINAQSRAEGMRSVAATCLYSGGKTIGVLLVSSSKPEAFSRRELQALEFMAGSMAAFIVNAANYEAAKTGSKTAFLAPSL